MPQSNLCKILAVIGLSTALASGMVFAEGGAYAKPVFIEGARQQGFADVVALVKPAVVSVQVKSDKQDNDQSFTSFFSGPGFDQLPDGHPLKRFFRDFYGRDLRPNKPSSRQKHLRPVAQGSGFFISKDGYIVTNNHVVSDGTAYSVVLDDGTELDAKLVGTDPRTDIAVLKVNDSKREFTYVDFAEDSKVHVGDWVVAVGNPFGLGGTVTAGIISARGRDIGANVYDDFLQIDAAVNRGNSGGPTFDLQGQVVGINTAIFSPSGGNVGIAFAIPASTAKQVVEQLVKYGTVKRGWIGVVIQGLTKEMAEGLGLPDTNGALVADISPADGPAAKAGIKAGDVILSLNGEKIINWRNFARRIANIHAGDSAILSVWRGGKEQDITVKIGELKGDDEKGDSASSSKDQSAVRLSDYGLMVTPSDDGPGLVITRVYSDSDAAERGLRPGDVIVAVNNREVNRSSDILDAIKEAKKAGRSAIVLRVQTDGQNRFIALPIK
ncbi:Do family serine endopeptidase [Bartonella sp. DGB2]|uniref:Do family serine endopeptidase n=1 Tax=Bartonella sp. DGB2 TaxID=3388426 RepID=UPI0039902822